MIEKDHLPVFLNDNARCVLSVMPPGIHLRLSDILFRTGLNKYTAYSVLVRCMEISLINKEGNTYSLNEEKVKAYTEATALLGNNKKNAAVAISGKRFLLLKEICTDARGVTSLEETLVGVYNTHQCLSQDMKLLINAGLANRCGDSQGNFKGHKYAATAKGKKIAAFFTDAEKIT